MSDKPIYETHPLKHDLVKIEKRLASISTWLGCIFVVLLATWLMLFMR